MGREAVKVTNLADRSNSVFVPSLMNSVLLICPLCMDEGPLDYNDKMIHPPPFGFY